MNVTFTIKDEHVRWALEDAGYEPTDEDVENVIAEMYEEELEDRLGHTAWAYIQEVAVDVMEEE